MLAEQEYAGHTSVHDDETAAELGLAGAPIEGPTHFSQFDPLAVERWGRAWFERGCVSSHFLNMVVEGEQMRAALEPVTPTLARIDAREGRRDAGADRNGIDRPRRPDRTRRAAPARARRPRGAAHRRPARDRHEHRRSRTRHDGVRRPTTGTSIRSASPRSSNASPSDRRGTSPTATARGAVRSSRRR